MQPLEKKNINIQAQILDHRQTRSALLRATHRDLCSRLSPHRNSPVTSRTPNDSNMKCKVSSSICERGRMNAPRSSERLQQLEHDTERVGADYRLTGNRHAPAPAPLGAVVTAGPPALQQQPLIKLALLTSATAQQLICSVWMNKQGDTSQRGRGTARTRYVCQPRNATQLWGHLARLMEERRGERFRGGQADGAPLRADTPSTCLHRKSLRCRQQSWQDTA